MEATTATRPTDTRDQAIRRLAFQAITRGLRIFEHQATGEFFCSSYSQPDRCHRVTALSCDCAGFIRHGRCQHHALLLFQIGELPPSTGRGEDAIDHAA
jgi:hypothetical protein